MKRINLNHIKALIELANLGPYYGLLSMKLCEVGIGYSKVEVDLENKHLNPFGAIHGGAYSSAIDTAAYWAVYCELDENVSFTTIDINVDILSMTREGKMIVEGKSLKAGRSICLSEAIARDTNGKLLAYGTSKMMIVQGLQSISHAIDAMGYHALPPKFLV
jgi:uncharacterized protein (TIGR00369 family)